MITEKGVFLCNISNKVTYLFTKTVSDIEYLLFKAYIYYKLLKFRVVGVVMFRNE